MLYINIEMRIGDEGEDETFLIEQHITYSLN